MILLIIFLPGTWICYGLSRYLLHFFPSLPQEDQLVMSELAAMVYLLSALMRLWEIWQRTGVTPSTPPASVKKEQQNQ